MASSALLGTVAVISHLLLLFPPHPIVPLPHFQGPANTCHWHWQRHSQSSYGYTHARRAGAQIQRRGTISQSPNTDQTQKVASMDAARLLCQPLLCFLCASHYTALLCCAVLCFALLCCALLTLLCTWFVYWLFLFLHFALLRALLVVDICCHSCAAVPAYIKPCPWPAPTQLMAAKEKWQEPR